MKNLLGRDTDKELKGRDRFLKWITHWKPLLDLIVPNLFSAIIIIVIVIHAFLYRSQWLAMQDQANLARQAIEESKRATEIQNAAYVGIKDARLWQAIEFDTVQHAQIVIENTGVTPAINYRIASRIEFRDRDVPEPMPLPGVTPGQQGLSVLPHGAAYSSDLSTVELNSEQIEAMRTSSSGWRLYLFGQITYKDVFGNTYKHVFCLVERGNPSRLFTSCANNNYFIRESKKP